MRSNYLKTLKTAVLAATVLLLGVSVSFGQQQINLTAPRCKCGVTAAVRS
jgi:hypothetical protein